MSKPTFTETVTPAQLQQLAAKGFGTESGTLPETSGVSLSYVVSGSVITFTVEHKPMFVPVSAIQSHVKTLMQGV